jgi:hypothetical protein
VHFYPVGTKNAVIGCVFGDMKLGLMFLICLIRAMFPTYADRFKISLCRLPKTDDFNFFVKNMDDKSYVSGRFVDGDLVTETVSGNSEVTEELEHHVSFDISERSFIIEDDGTVTIDNENADDRFYVSAVSDRPFPPVVLTYNRERQIVCVPYTSKNPWDKAEENGFEIVRPDAWVVKQYEDACGEVFLEKDKGKHGSCHIF